MTGPISRRRFIAGGALYGGTLWLTLRLPRPRTAAAAAASAEPVVLSAGEWKTVEAICGRIIPVDDDPGAVEAGCVNFIDKALANEDEALVHVYRKGLAALDGVAAAREGGPFAGLAPERQDALLGALQDGKVREWKETAVGAADFFESVRVHTVIGFLADPRHGGNRDHAGWKLVGYPGPRHSAGGYTREQMLGTAPIVAVWGEEIA